MYEKYADVVWVFQMKLLSELKSRGISLRRLNIIMACLAIVASIMIFVAMGKTNDFNEAMIEATDDLMEWRNSAYELQIASDYLTEQIRGFAITKDKSYLSGYFEEANVVKRRDKAVAVLEENFGDTEAVKSLRLAMENSLELMNREYYAGKLVILAMGYSFDEFPDEIENVSISDVDEALSNEEKLDLAVRMLFDDVYIGKKRQISGYMQKCMDELISLIEDIKLENADRLRTQVAVEHILTIVLVVLLLGIVSLTSILVFIPLKNAIKLIRNEKSIPVKGAYEVRFLARTYNLINRVSRESREKLEFDATHDELTGLYNRRGYDFLLNNVDLDTSALLLIDLDEFKKINDTYGHDVGDKALNKVAGVLHKSFRAQDFVCRIGGDEFAVIMIHAEADLKDLIRNKIKKINDQLKQDTEKEGLPPISLSAGVVFGDKEHNSDAIFKEADEALYEAKGDKERDVIFHESE